MLTVSFSVSVRSVQRVPDRSVQQLDVQRHGRDHGCMFHCCRVLTQGRDSRSFVSDFIDLHQFVSFSIQAH
jgi:hypothetical protein